ncbi:hypothetical protein K438DRAFT_542738 [Mycena galopus ATCC 62051]|nr:hypothetical protein K438DRAFT_542738 [Mycena galopus ATCC 62051]
MCASRRNTRRTSSPRSSSCSSPNVSHLPGRATASCTAEASFSAAPSRPSGPSPRVLRTARTSSPSHRTFPLGGVATCLSLYARVQRASDAYSCVLDGISAKTSRRSLRDIHAFRPVRECWRQAMRPSRCNDTPRFITQSRKTARDHGLRGCVARPPQRRLHAPGAHLLQSFAQVVALTSHPVLSKGVASLHARVQRAASAYSCVWVVARTSSWIKFVRSAPAAMRFARRACIRVLVALAAWTK